MIEVLGTTVDILQFLEDIFENYLTVYLGKFIFYMYNIHYTVAAITHCKMQQLFSPKEKLHCYLDQ